MTRRPAGTPRADSPTSCSTCVRRRVVAVVVAGLASIGVLVSIGALGAVPSEGRRDARASDASAEHAASASRALAAAAARAAGRDDEAAVVLAREAVAAAPTFEATTVLGLALDRRRAPGFAAHAGFVTSAVWAPDGRAVLTTSRNGDARCWDPEGDASSTCAGHAAGLATGAFAPDGRSVVTGGADATARVFGVDGTPRGVLHGATDEVTAVAFAPDGGLVVVVSVDRRARVHRPTGELVATLAAPDGVDAATWTPDGRRILTFARAGAARLWSRVGALEVVFAAEAGGVRDARVLAGGTRVVTRSDVGPARVWDLAGHEVARLDGHGAAVVAIAVDPSGALLATASLDGTARLFTSDGRAVAVLTGHRSSVFDVAFAPVGDRLVTVASDRTARLWRRSGALVAAVGGADGSVRSARFSPDGARLVTTSLEASGVRLWSADGAPLVWLAQGHGPVLEATFSPDGERLLLVDSDLRADVVPATAPALVAEARRLAPRELTALERATAATDSRAPVPAGTVVPAPAPAPATASPRRGDFVGAAACAACHREAYELWRTSAHAGTLALADPSNVAAPDLEGGLVAHPPGWTRFRLDGTRLVARTVGDDGAPHDYDLTHVVGARRIRMYVARLEDGRQQVLPSMRQLPGGPWFDYTHLLFGAPDLDPATPPTVAPGDPSFWTGPVRSFDARCAGCHASGREPLAPPPDAPGTRSTWRALGVDCEACHGPGRAHAEAWAHLETGAPLPRLETLDRVGKVQACTQCHLEGERLTPHAVVGEDLLEHVDPTLLLDPQRVDPYGRPLELIYDGLPFGVSRCAEEGGLTCSRCHAPHGSPARALLRPAFDDRASCGTCHEAVVRDVRAHAHHDPAGRGGRCVACHMPFLEIERGHGTVADHTIGVPIPGLAGDRVARDACTACHARGGDAGEGGPALDGETVRAAYRRWWPTAAPHAWQRALAAARLGEPGGAARLVAVLDDAGAYRPVRASAVRLLGRYPDEARAPLLRASRDADALVRRAALTALGEFRGADVDARLLEALGDPSRAVRTSAARAALAGWARVQDAPALLRAALPILEADAASVPDDDQRWFRLGAARELAGDVAGAIAAYDRQVALDPFATNVRAHATRLRAGPSPAVGR